VTDAEVDARPRGLGVSLILGGALGVLASAALIVEKIESLKHPASRLSCDVSVFVGCSASLDSQQGELLGFPNPVFGLAFWSAIVTIGVVIVAIGNPRWMWIALAAGMTGSMVLVAWFIAQSIYVIGVLCPWCMLTWAVTTPLFLLVVSHTLRSGIVPVPPGARRAAKAVYDWVVIITLVVAVIVAMLAQLRLGLFTRF
jgi:uncharacterized membrane protein